MRLIACWTIIFLALGLFKPLHSTHRKNCVTYFKKFPLAFSFLHARGELWENMAADQVLSELFERLRSEPYYSSFMRGVRDEVQGAWLHHQNQSDQEFISGFVASNPELFEALKANISAIFD
jgi:hypothetical protein